MIVLHVLIAVVIVAAFLIFMAAGLMALFDPEHRVPGPEMNHE